MHQNIEVEIRGLLTKECYDRIIKFLDAEGQNKELDDRKTTFFIIPEKTLKITQKVSQNKAKICLKTGDIAKASSQTEFEIDIEPSQFAVAENIFLQLGYTQIQHTEQKRINYVYEGVEFAIKWSVDFGYHFEMEVMVGAESEVASARDILHSLAARLDLQVMSSDEFGARCREIDLRYELKSA